MKKRIVRPFSAAVGLLFAIAAMPIHAQTPIQSGVTVTGGSTLGQNINCASPTRGQNETDKCATDATELHSNDSDATQVVTGDLKVYDDSCTVQITGVKTLQYKAGTDKGISVTLNGGNRGNVLKGQCASTLNKSKCHWEFTRTSP